MIILDLVKSENIVFRNGKFDIQSILINEYPEGVEYKLHEHVNPEIFCLLGGESTYTINDKEYTVTPGKLVILNGNTMHAERSHKDNPVKLITCKLEHVSIPNLAPNQIIPPDYSPVIDCEDCWESIRTIFFELSQNHLKNAPFAYEEAQLNIQKLIIYAYRNMKKMEAPGTQAPSNLPLSSLIKDYIDKNYHKNITLESLSEQFFVSANHISHEMKKDLNVSPINYLIDRRIGEAQRYLVFTNKSINEISELAGYDNPSYFNRLFLKKTGVTAARFRQDSKNNENILWIPENPQTNHL